MGALAKPLLQLKPLHQVLVQQLQKILVSCLKGALVAKRQNTDRYYYCLEVWIWSMVENCLSRSNIKLKLLSTQMITVAEQHMHMKLIILWHYQCNWHQQVEDCDHLWPVCQSPEQGSNKWYNTEHTHYKREATWKCVWNWDGISEWPKWA